MGSVGFSNKTLLDRVGNTLIDAAGMAGGISERITQKEYLQVPINFTLAIPCLFAAIGQNAYYALRKNGN